MMNIYVAGSLEHGLDDRIAGKEFIGRLGVAVVKEGHVLLNGCRSSFDVEIARVAHKWLSNHRHKGPTTDLPDDQLISYFLKSEQPVHSYGVIRRSVLKSWKMDQLNIGVPEQIDNADAAIFVGGNTGTFWARNWAYYARKPIFGIPRFDGAGGNIYDQELKYLQATGSVYAEQYERLNQASSDIETYAREVVAVVEHIVRPRSVFVIMSFKPEFDPLYEIFQIACEKYGFKAIRTKESLSAERITHMIENGIRQSAFVIADLTELSPNVLYEVGFARALGKDVVLTARQTTKLPFDVFDLQTVFWEQPDELKTGGLHAHLGAMARKHRK